MDRCHALMRGDTIYSLKPYRDPWGRKDFKWQGFKDGKPWKFFKTKADFERDVGLEPLGPPPGPHALDTRMAEFLSTHKGNEMLDMLSDRKRKEQSRESP